MDWMGMLSCHSIALMAIGSATSCMRSGGRFVRRPARAAKAAEAQGMAEKVAYGAAARLTPITAPPAPRDPECYAPYLAVARAGPCRVATP
jgi:hypothetical protein